IFGPMSTIAFASQVNGLYTGFVYFTPIFGGLIADRWIGRRNAVALGAILMSCGHIAMAFDQSFLLALLLLVIGSGFLKGNIAAQVGALYPEGDAAGRTRGYSIFSIAINVGAVAGPLACGLLAQIYGWHVGFGLAGGLMMIGLATYLIGYRTLAEQTAAAKSKDAIPAEKLDARQWRIIAAIIIAMLLSVFQSVAYYQNTNVGLIWIDQFVDMNVMGFQIPVGWFVSLDSFVSIVFVPVLFILWRWQQKHGGEPGEIGKMATGAWMAAAANLLLVLACLPGGRVSGIFPVVYDVILGIAFLYYWPTLLALVSHGAPARLKSTMMGVAYLSLFIGNLIVGRLGSLYESLGPANFWLVHASIAGVGAILCMCWRAH
ncbi:MAG: MFS transporter, partial [Hyphomonadaceae bacterium]